MLLLLAFALFYPGAAAAQDTASTAARAPSSDHVYVDADAEMAGRVDAGALRSRIGGEPIWIAVLPDNAGDPVSVARELRSDAGGEGAYGVIVGTQFRAGPGQDVAQAGNAAISAHPGDVQATLEDFVDRVKNGGGGGSGSGGSGISTGVVVVLLALLAGGGALLIGARRRTCRREAEELAEVRETARDDLVALGDDIRALDLDVQMPGANPQARTDYERAVNAYGRANRIFETARRPEDLAPASEALEEGRYAMTAAPRPARRPRTAGAPPALLLRPTHPRRRVGAPGRHAPPRPRMRGATPSASSAARNPTPARSAASRTGTPAPPTHRSTAASAAEASCPAS